MAREGSRENLRQPKDHLTLASTKPFRDIIFSRNPKSSHQDQNTAAGGEVSMRQRHLCLGMGSLRP